MSAMLEDQEHALEFYQLPRSTPPTIVPRLIASGQAAWQSVRAVLRNGTKSGIVTSRSKRPAFPLISSQVFIDFQINKGTQYGVDA